MKREFCLTDRGKPAATGSMIHTAAVLSDPAAVLLAWAAMGAILGLVPINGCAWSLRIEGGLYKATRAIWQRISPQRLSFPFSVTSFGGMNKNAEYNQTYPQYAQEYSKGEWEFLKKITRQTYGKNGFSKIGNNFRDKLSPGGVNDHFHHSNDNMIGNVCQTQFSRTSRIFAGLGLDPFDSA